MSDHRRPVSFAGSKLGQYVAAACACRSYQIVKGGRIRPFASAVLRSLRITSI